MIHLLKNSSKPIAATKKRIKYTVKGTLAQYKEARANEAQSMEGLRNSAQKF